MWGATTRARMPCYSRDRSSMQVGRPLAHHPRKHVSQFSPHQRRRVPISHVKECRTNVVKRHSCHTWEPERRSVKPPTPSVAVRWGCGPRGWRTPITASFPAIGRSPTRMVMLSGRPRRLTLCGWMNTPSYSRATHVPAADAYSPSVATTAAAHAAMATAAATTPAAGSMHACCIVTARGRTVSYRR